MEHDAAIVGMSALLTTTMPNMGTTIEAFDDAGERRGKNYGWWCTCYSRIC